MPETVAERMTAALARLAALESWTRENYPESAYLAALVRHSGAARAAGGRYLAHGRSSDWDAYHEHLQAIVALTAARMAREDAALALHRGPVN